jgi:hypothetical protein
VSRMNVKLSRNRNGAVHDGNIDQILPVLVRTGTEDVIRTPDSGLGERSQGVPAMEHDEEAR